MSQRLNDENSLSDITWAMANSDSKFMEIFMDQFSFNFKIDEPWNMYRESSEGDCRPDFRIEQADKQFIIENKIYDQNDHFEQYATKFPKAELGFIANYRAPAETAQKYSFKCVTWEDFIRVLSREYAEAKDDQEDVGSVMCQAYIGYVKEVCGIVDMKDMRFDNIVSLFYFAKVIKQTIQSSVQGYECWLYNQGKSCGDDYSGSYFGLKQKKGKVEVYPWFGIWYGESPPTINITFGRDWCSKIHDSYNNKNAGRYFAVPYNDKDDYNALVFELNQSVLSEFLGASLDRQKEILQSFFEEVIGEVGILL